MGQSTDPLNNRPLNLQSHELSDKNSKEIQDEIDKTRSEMDRTVDAIRERLAPQQLALTAVDALGEILRRDTPKVVEAIRRNPLPVALVSVGVGWMAYRATRPQYPDARSMDGYAYYGYGTGDLEYETLSDDPLGYDTEFDATGGLRERIGDMAERGRAKGGDFAYRARLRASNVMHGAADRVSARALAVRQRAAEKARRARLRSAEMIGGAAHAARAEGSHLADATGHALGSAAHSAAHLAGRAASGVVHAAGSAAGTAAHLAGEAAVAGARATGQAISGAGHMAYKSMNEIGQAARHAGSTATHAAADAGSRAAHAAALAARRTAYRTREGFSHRMDENPLAMGLVAFAVGAALAMLIPPTRREDELVGDLRDDLVDQARLTGRDALGRLRETGREAYEEVRQTATEAAHQVAQSARQAVAEGRETLEQPVHQAAERLKETGRHVGEELKAAGHDVAEEVKAAGHEAKEKIKGDKGSNSAGRSDEELQF